ncbi:MAG: hypothetical protein A2W35_09970 [Chloroflexi bacterium RBG_16_57_11]|nr:MAG: hypothetical protein A2W35_09970 [Chloroflexi bacterium RBG_16_57_11]
MNDKAFENKVDRDIDKAKEDLATLRDDGVTGLSRKVEQLADDAKKMVADQVKTVNKEIGQGLSQYNAKVQNIADRVPSDFSKMVAVYPWVTITISLAFGLLLGALLKPSRV